MIMKGKADLRGAGRNRPRFAGSDRRQAAAQDPHLPHVLLLADHPVEQPRRGGNLAPSGSCVRSSVASSSIAPSIHAIRFSGIQLAARSPSVSHSPGVKCRSTAGSTDSSTTSRWSATAAASSVRMSTTTPRRSASATAPTAAAARPVRSSVRRADGAKRAAAPRPPGPAARDRAACRSNRSCSA